MVYIARETDDANSLQFRLLRYRLPKCWDATFSGGGICRVCMGKSPLLTELDRCQSNIVKVMVHSSNVWTLSLVVIG